MLYTIDDGDSYISIQTKSNLFKYEDCMATYNARSKLTD